MYMKTFNKLKEMQPYYNADCNAYIFEENHDKIDIHINFILKTTKNICANNITARDITARDINACDITAKNIEFYAVCFSYKTFVCDSVKGRRENSKYFCLDSKVVINKKRSLFLYENI